MRGRGSGDTNEFYASQRKESQPKTWPAWDGDDGYVEGAREPFGYLLTLDMYRCRPAVLGSLEEVYRYLESLADSLGMHKQAPPYVLRSPDDFPSKKGISAWLPLIESGISVHTLEERGFVSVDIYCCHKFDVNTVLAVSKLYFAPEDIDLHEIKRGVRYHAE
jgi:S-adenosylmethionine/arginine decarboxylase-like enzyme